MALRAEIGCLEMSIAEQKKAAAEADDNLVEQFGDWLFGNEPAGPDPALVAQLHAVMAMLEQVQDRLQHVAEEQKHLSNGIEANLAKAGQLAGDNP